MKMKKFWARGGRKGRAPPLDPPLTQNISSTLRDTYKYTERQEYTEGYLQYQHEEYPEGYLQVHPV